MSRTNVLGEWVDYTADVCRQPVTTFPSMTLLDMLRSTFHGSVEWNSLQGGDQRWIFLHPPAGWPPPGATDYALAHMTEHPLVRWFGQTRDSAPMTVGRIPEAVADRRLVAAARDVLGPDMHQELAIPVAFSRGDHAVFNIHQGGHDFTDEDLALARQLQPPLMLLDRQAALSAQLTLGLTERFQLTSRQVAILSLLREGRSVPAIGARLCCSPRTVEKHVEHIYRKLGVRDRLSAVRVAEMYDAANAHEAREGSRTARTGLGLDHGGRRDLLVLSGTLQSAEPLYPSRPLDAMTA